MIEKRKSDHVEICLKERVNHSYNYWNDILIYHNALPEINFNEVNMSTTFLGKKLGAPIMVAPMSGGYTKGKEINKNIAEACANLSIGMGVGSQRAMVKDNSLKETYGVIKEYGVPLVFGNVGAPQLVSQNGEKVLTMDNLREFFDTINADALMIHLNSLQELVQPEGDVNFSNVLNAINDVSKEFPVVVKEVGAGISKDVALKLKSAGVKAIDVSGVSGTSWAAVEYYRAKFSNDIKKAKFGRMFWNWGIPSPVCVKECSAIGVPIISEGGIRNGKDVARSIILGADIASIGRRLLPSSITSSKDVENEISLIIEELKAVMFLTGSKNLIELKGARHKIIGRTKEWLND